MKKGEAILQAIREANVGEKVIIQNEDGSIYCILKVICKEHEEEPKE